MGDVKEQQAAALEAATQQPLARLWTIFFNSVPKN
jgi:hypothetical protein